MISVVVPTFNEVKNIEGLLERLDKSFKAHKKTWEVIFVDDNSTDGSWELLTMLKAKYPHTFFRKKGLKGKAYSLIEGFEKAKGEILAMIDGDLQYPPEAIVPMVEAIDKDCDIIVANRKNYKTSKVRWFMSRSFKYVFGNLMFGIGCDIQSGLKVFKKEVFNTIKFHPKTGWTFDLEFLHRAKTAGFLLKALDIDFEARKNGASKISFAKNTIELTTRAILLRAKKIEPVSIAGKIEDSMQGAGHRFGSNKYITHTTLHHKKSAIYGLVLWQKMLLLPLITSVSVGFFIEPLLTAISLVAILSVIYFLDVIFNLFLVLKSLNNPPEIRFSQEKIKTINEKSLPVYSILCPLYREAAVLPEFLNSISQIDWPKDKLEVLLLLEEDDDETQNAVSQITLPAYVKAVIVPDSAPKTKPKACNYGLSLAKGTYVVIYDAEDRPDPLQLKKAYLGFLNAGKNIICLQAKLSYFNPHQNLLTRLFTAEYSLWFDVVLTGLQSINTAIPLGGTSNHFRTEDLIKLEAWDPFNVTEDADLGVRLFKAGYKTAIIDSTTLEEANSQIGNWIRQRSRWIKGYMQTYLVHMRNPIEFTKTNGVHALVFQLVVGGKIAFMFINPILWIATISYFALNSLVGPTIEALYPSVIFYMAAFSLIFGNFMFMYYYMIGCVKREQWQLMKFVFLVPFYWLLVSVAAVKALNQLIFRPHFWEKTMHGLNMERVETVLEETVVAETGIPRKRFSKIRGLMSSGVAAGGVLVFASILGNILNFLYNAFLARTVSIEEFGLLSLMGSFLLLSTIPLNALQRTVTRKSAYYLGKYDLITKDFWRITRKRSMLIGVCVMVLWLILIPVLAKFFNTTSLLPFILFAPVWFIGTLAAVDGGLLGGNLKFRLVAIVLIVEAFTKLLITWIFVKIGFPSYVYAAIPASMALAFLTGWFFASRIKGQEIKIEKKKIERFPFAFFISSILTKFSTVAFISFDVLLAKHYLSPVEAGQYALLALVGKMIFFVGALFTQFILPLVSREEGAEGNSKRVFLKILTASSLFSFVVYLGVGLLGFVTTPIIFGNKIESVVSLLPIYGFAMFCFTVASCVVAFHQTRDKHIFAFASFVLAIVQVVAIALFHSAISELALVMTIVGFTNLLVMSALHFASGFLYTVWRNILDFAGVFKPLTETFTNEATREKRVLIFNWRDTKHKWSGGAEVYLHELSKRLVESGFSVTVFCGNDHNSSRYEEIDGVKIIRRGGFYTVYFWAFLYYIFKLRKHTDIIIDSENGLPFFTPIYVGKPVIGLVHHVHQEVFRNHLRFPFTQFAQFLEGRLMPFVYRNVQMVTVSNSSKKAMEAIGFGKKRPIEIINPGVELDKFKPSAKTVDPSILYLGRLKPYKSIDTAILAFEKVRKHVPNATFTIAGEGESRKALEKLVGMLGLGGAVKFIGKVTEEAKVELYSKSWLMVQPSSVEGWGITAIEANASGTPVVASNVAGLKDSVSNPHSGYLVPWGDVEKFADRIKHILTNDKIRKEFEAGSLKWSKQFSWKSSAKKLMELINYDLKIRNKKLI